VGKGPGVAFGRTLFTPKADNSYKFGLIKKNQKSDSIQAKAKTYIPMFLDYLEVKINQRSK